MSKKKAFGGNTMTLKDFHGGSIPSDLPLPSAPGVVVRSSEWSGYDRPNSWGGPTGRPDHRARPNSSPAIRNFDDKAPFLSHSSHIGRHFDEDERKPLDGGSAPRRTISDDAFRSITSKVDLRPEPLTSGRVSGSTTVSQASRTHLGANFVNVGSSLGQGTGGSNPNVWAVRKELGVGASEPVQSAWSGVSAVSKLANASALEKVSSGLWQSKQNQVEVEVIEHLGFVNNRGECSDAMLARHMERGMGIEDGIQIGRKEFVDHERVKEKSISETVERPRVKLLPRTKPLEGFDAPVVDPKQGFQQLNNLDSGRAGTNGILHGNNLAVKSSSVALESENQVMERPKLNLKPRSLPIEVNVEKERVGLFGGARPRELVLKERGVDSTPISNHGSVQQPERVKHNAPKIERAPDHTVHTRHNLINNDQRAVRNGKDHRTDNERADKLRRNRRNENRQNGQQERAPSPETWRKPVEPPKPASPDTAGRRHVASALELAQAFSKSFSEPKQADRYSKPQVPFSRLTSPAPRPQINGY